MKTKINVKKKILIIFIVLFILACFVAMSVASFFSSSLSIIGEVTPQGTIGALETNFYLVCPAKSQLEREAEILAKYNLPENYILLSFLNSRTVSLQWQHEFQLLAERKGMACVALPFPQGMKFKHCLQHEIPSPLLPLDWYALIKYSQGYVGHNMHPIIVSLHNANPFFSFDNYGIKKLNGLWSDDYSSKIKHILSLAGLPENRISCLRRSFVAPVPELVLERLMNGNKEKMMFFSMDYLKKYNIMMQEIVSAIS